MLVLRAWGDCIMTSVSMHIVKKRLLSLCRLFQCLYCPVLSPSGSDRGLFQDTPRLVLLSQADRWVPETQHPVMFRSLIGRPSTMQPSPL